MPEDPDAVRIQCLAMSGTSSQHYELQIRVARSSPAGITQALGHPTSRRLPRNLRSLRRSHGPEQASRCILCPNPNCVRGCPFCNPDPGWMQLTAEGRFLEAAALLGSSPTWRRFARAFVLAIISVKAPVCWIGFPSRSRSGPWNSFCRIRVCARRAETATAPPNGRKVAILGSGPGGLACAEELARKGYSVTVFDSELVPGGLLVNGVPAFKVDRSIVQRRIDLLKQMRRHFPPWR